MGEGKDPSFGWLVASRAWFAAWRFFESKVRDAAIFIGTLLVGGIAYYSLYGLPATEDQIMPVLIFTVGPLVALWLLLFVWHLWLAPSALVYEAAKNASGPAPQKASPAINWAVWKQRTAYDLNEFAAVLAKDDPTREPKTPEARGFLKLLQEDIMGGKLQASRDRNADDSCQPDTFPFYFYVQREQALRWATAKGFDLSHIT